MTDRASPAKITRRKAMTFLAVTTATPMLTAKAFAQQAGAAPDATSQLMPDANVCVIIPETTEGPFYFDPALERIDITEGRPGVPTRLRLQIVDAMCRPQPGARVDVWHCDAAGLYSGYPNQGETGASTVGETFMRGTQFADADGMVEFDTVYPGWYPGRTPHIHFKVLLDESTLLTGQLFFPDDVSQHVYDTVAPYNERGIPRQTFNSNDGIAAQAGPASVANVTPEADTYLVALIVGVDPAAR